MAEPARQSLPGDDQSGPSREDLSSVVTEKARISITLALLMIIVALGFDMAQAGTNFLHVIPLLGTAAALVLSFFIGFLAQCVFLIWFALLHVRGGEKMKAFAIRMLIHMATFVIEVIPVINAIPAITLGVVAIILVSRAQATLGDLQDVSDEKLGEFMRKHKRIAGFAQKRYERMRADMYEANSPLADAAEAQSQKRTGKSHTQYQDEYRQKQIDAADQVDLTQPQPNLNRPKPKPWF
ncbi:hypothetical protein K2Y00_02425 [Patescibacteria group bacterium]|nr:hypothetical protein [Patescibacteria group bacterium]